MGNDGADVYSIDIDSIYLFRAGKSYKVDENETPESCVKKSSVVITGVPTKTYRLNTEWIQPKTTVVNVASFKNVDEEALLKIPDITYVPMVGKVTVAMLERNLMRLFDNFHHPKLQDQRVQQSSGVKDDVEDGESGRNLFFMNALHFYTALVSTAVLALLVARKK